MNASFLNPKRSIDLIHPKIRIQQEKYLLQHSYEKSWIRFFEKLYGWLVQTISELHPIYIFLICFAMFWVLIMIYERIKKQLGIKSPREEKKQKLLIEKQKRLYFGEENQQIDPNEVLNW